MDENNAVELLAGEMKKKLARKALAGYQGWQDLPEEMFWNHMAVHLLKKDPVDIANYCAMILWKRNAR